MKNGQEYLCTLEPLEPYFFCGERDFRFSGGETGADYFIESEELPQQSTLLGTIRFLMLSKAGLLNDGYRSAAGEKLERQRELVGRQGFQAAAGQEMADFGKLHGIGPLFLLQASTGTRHRWIPAPLNHGGGAAYRPLAMEGGFWTEMGRDSLLPMDYDAKRGLPDAYLDLDTPGCPAMATGDLIGSQEHTRIGRGAEDKGYFKSVCRTLRQGYRFAFYCRAESGVLPSREIAYMGHGKSAFRFVAEETDGQGQESLENAIRALPGCDLAPVYYAWSDLFLDLDREMQERLSYAIVQKRLFRTLDTLESARNFRDSRKKSQLFQLVRAGSVFYVRPGQEDAFRKALEQPGRQQAGFNYVEKLGGSRP